MANTTELWPRFRELETERRRVVRRLAEIDAELEGLARGLMNKVSGTKDATPKAAKASPRATGKHGPTFTDQVLAQVKGTRTAPSIVASLGLKVADRRRVYKVLAKAVDAGRIRRVGEGKFAPR